MIAREMSTRHNNTRVFWTITRCDSIAIRIPGVSYPEELEGGKEDAAVAREAEWKVLRMHLPTGDSLEALHSFRCDEHLFDD